MIRFALLLFAILLTGCAGAASLPSGDTRRWLSYRIEIGDQVLQFSIPPGVSEDFMDPREVPKRIDLRNPATFDETGSAGILVRHWDYRRNAFSRDEGTLVASIGLIYSEQSLDGLPTLQAAVKSHYELIEWLLRAKDPKYKGPSTPPVRFDPVKIAGRDALYVSYRILPSNYVVIFDAHHYLGIEIYNPVSQPGWREDAQAAADGILKSIKIEPKK